jgi:hypothetical protein
MLMLFKVLYYSKLFNNNKPMLKDDHTHGIPFSRLITESISWFAVENHVLMVLLLSVSNRQGCIFFTSYSITVVT